MNAAYSDLLVLRYKVSDVLVVFLGTLILCCREFSKA